MLGDDDGAGSGHGDELSVSPSTGRLLVVVAAVLAVVILVGIVLLRSRDSPNDQLGQLDLGTTFYDDPVKTVHTYQQ